MADYPATGSLNWAGPLQDYIDEEGGTGTGIHFVSTDGSFDLPTPTGVGAEFVVVGDVLDDIRFDGNSL